MSSTLVIGDGHTSPEDTAYQKSRWKSLSNYIRETQPDNIVQIGDFLTFDSISSHNRNKRLELEGQRLKTELEAGREAYNMLMAEIDNLNAQRRRNRQALYKPGLFWVEGNHEDRANRYLQENPQMEGLVDYKTFFDPREDGWTIVPYREHCQIHGVLFTHIPMNGINNPIGSKHSVKNVIKDYDSPVVFGHNHKLVLECDGVRTTDGGKRLTALSVGCFFFGVPPYARNSGGSRDWWRGLVTLHHRDGNGDYDISTTGLQFLMENF